MSSVNLFSYVARSVYDHACYSCPVLKEYGGDSRDEDAWQHMFMHEMEYLLDPSVGFWDVNPGDRDANNIRVWALLLAHAMRQTGDM